MHESQQALFPRTVLKPSLVIVALWSADGSNGFINGKERPNHRDPQWTEEAKLDVGRDKVHRHTRTQTKEQLIFPILAATAGDATLDYIKDW